MADEKDTKDTSTSRGTSAAPSAKTTHPESGPVSKTDGGNTLSGADRDRRRMLQGLPDEVADEYAALGVNPALDNRMGDQRPRTGALAPKPQQVPGPEVGHFGAHDDEVGDDFREQFGAAAQGDAVGMRAEGPHGRGEEA